MLQADTAAIKSVPFSLACSVAMRVLTAPALVGKVFLEGGLVPWIVSGRDSRRLHGDVDISLRIADMPDVRTWLVAEGLYDRALDSLNLPCNEEHGDFGVHSVIDGVLVSFCPFFFESDELHQRNAALKVTDGFDALLEAVIPCSMEDDRTELRRLPTGVTVGCATLEAVRASKIMSDREKDAYDIAEIDRIGYDLERYARIAKEYATMRIVCVAHGE